MNKLGLRARALSTMNELAASLLTAATSAAARSMPAVRRTASSVASPLTDDASYLGAVKRMGRPMSAKGRLNERWR